METSPPSAEPAAADAAESETKGHAASSEDKELEDTETEEETRCDWIVCGPSACKKLSTPTCLLLLLCWCSFTQGMLVNGFVNSVLTTLELRYDLKSAESGLIASSYDIGSALCLLPVTFIGRRYRRSRLIAIGTLIMGLGSFIFALPQFTVGRYTYQSPVAPLCYTAGRSYPEFCSGQVLNNYKWVFWFGQFLHGVGSSPYYTLAVAYLDDNLTVKQSGAFLGVYYMMSVLGPAMGYLLGGIFLEFYVDLGYTPDDLSPSNTSLWVGAWWMGFLVTGAMAVLIVVPMFGFPTMFPGSKRIRKEKQKEAYGESNEKCEQMEMSLKDFLPSLRILLTNPTFVFLSLTGAADAVLVAGLSTFGPKVLQTLFFMRASTATLTVGLVSVPCAAVGLMIGGLVIRFTNLSVKQLLWMCVIASVVGILLGFGFLIRCSEQNFAGVNSLYNSAPTAVNNLTSGCNSNCNCNANKFLFSPLCGADRKTYYSPCYAGCPANGSLINGVTYYSNCSCIIGSAVLAGGANYSAASGSCTDPNCNTVGVILFMIGMFLFSVFFITVPTLQCTMRVIPSMLKDFGLGTQWMFLRCLGSIPGPLVLGRLIDVACNLWTGGCGSLGSCSFYNSTGFLTLILVFVFSLKLLDTLFLILAAVLYTPPKASEAANPEQAHENKAFDNRANVS